jgi:hypothetical protein
MPIQKDLSLEGCGYNRHSGPETVEFWRFGVITGEFDVGFQPILTLALLLHG